MELSRRVQSLPPYHFAAYARKIAEKRASGVDVISLSMGDPDLPTPPEVIEALTIAAQNPVNQRYPEYAGMPELRQAYAGWFQRRFGVTLDPATEILPLIGSKEGLAHLPAVVMNEGDVALVPSPNYPVAETAVAMVGGVAHELPLAEESGWLPNLGAIPADILARARTLWLNYPNNPTGATAPRVFFEEAVRFAHEHHLLLIHDMAYAEVNYDGARPISVLEIEGARDVAVELHSLSKAYNMAGFRIGALVGNASVVEGMTRYKSNIDTGIFRPIQIAATRALALPPEWVAERNAIYQRRRDRVVAAFQRIGLRATTPEAGLYVWPHIPKGRTSTEFAYDLLDSAGIAVTPGTNFGARGEGYVRISLTVPDDRLDEAMARLEQNIAARAN